MKNIILTGIILVVLCACSSNKAIIAKQLDHKLSSSFYKNQFTGVLIIDAKTKDTLYNQRSDAYFIPASNTKIFTLFAALKILPKQIPALRYVETNDTLYFEGTGDPAFLHAYLKDSTAFKFLASQANLVYATENFQEEKYGPGWAWDDYQWYYSPERSGLPLYGNVVMSFKNPEFHVSPTYFKDSVYQMLHKNTRNETANTFFYPSQSTDTLETPYITGIQTTTAILEHTLNTKIGTTLKMPTENKQTLYGMATDSLYKRMMHESDNFIAEQLLLVAASELKDTLNGDITRTYILEHELSDLAQQPRWVDGSGLSRYNLFTPQNMVSVLDRLYTMIPQKRLFTIFPEGGSSEMMADANLIENEPFLYAKSGTLSNNFCLSGYLRTDSGKTLIFSFMNNHFRQSVRDERLHVGAMLKILHATY